VVFLFLILPDFIRAPQLPTRISGDAPHSAEVTVVFFVKCAASNRSQA
jgi:hypothetical protein